VFDIIEQTKIHRKDAEGAEDFFLFCFPLRGRKAKTNHFLMCWFIPQYKTPAFIARLNTILQCFSLAVACIPTRRGLSTAKEKYYFLCDLCVSSEAGGK
jgi:hypothetical protein